MGAHQLEHRRRVRSAVAVSLALFSASGLIGSPTDAAAMPRIDEHDRADPMALERWIAGLDEATGGGFTADHATAATGTVRPDGSIAGRHDWTPGAGTFPEDVEVDVTFIGSFESVGGATTSTGATETPSRDGGVPTSWDRALQRGWEARDRGTDVVVVRHTGEVAAYLCGAGSWEACLVARGSAATISGELRRELEFGVVRDAIVEHPGQGESDGRFLALAVRHRAPQTAQELADLVLRNESRPDPAVTDTSTARTLSAAESAEEIGAATALEVSLDAAWIAALRLAGVAPHFERYVAITAAPPRARLRAGDRVLHLDGEPVGRGMFVPTAGRSDSDGVFTVVRDDELLAIPAADIDPQGVRTLEAARTARERPPMIVRSTTAGPSAGIVSTLAYLDAITPGDLTGGLTVAGSGSVTPHGHLDPVGGIDAKTAAAVAAGADVLFVHPDNLAEAVEHTPLSIPVIPVDTVGEAVDWLTTHGADQPVAVTTTPAAV